MKRFVVPPNWPMPPRRSWVPPKTWHPDPDWPPAPKGWKFWVNGKGKPVIGPVGRYGAPSVRAMVAGLGGAVLFVSVNLWALAAVGMFDGGSSKPQVAPAISESPSESVTVTPSAPGTTPTAPPQGGPVTPPPARTTETSGPPTLQTSKPVESADRSTPTPTRSEQRPSPQSNTTVSTSPVPSPTTAGTPTPEGPFAQYCHQLGDPKWCDPASSATPQPPGKSRKHR